MEYIDILDEHGNKTGEVKEKQEVHIKGYLHKVVYVCIINSKREILMQRRSETKSAFPNKLDISVGGHPRNGEDEIQGITREALEEIGIEIDTSKLEYLFTLPKNYELENIKENQLISVYLLEMDLDINKVKLQKEEVSEVKYVPYTEFEKMVKDKSEEIVPFTNGWNELCKILNERYK